MLATSSAHNKKGTLVMSNVTHSTKEVKNAGITTRWSASPSRKEDRIGIARIGTRSSIEEEISDCTDAVNFILAYASCPTDHRAFIDAVIGLANGRVAWFEACDYEIGKRMVGGTAWTKSPCALKKRVQRARKVFNEWQKSSGYIFIECSPGGQNRDGERFPSKYRLPLLTEAAASLRTIRKASQTDKRSDDSLSRAARTALKSLRGEFVAEFRFNRPRQDEYSVLSRSRKSIITLTQKAVDITKNLKQDPRYFLVTLGTEIAKLYPSSSGEAATDFIKALDEFVHSHAPMDKSVHRGTREHGGRGARNSAPAQPDSHFESKPWSRKTLSRIHEAREMLEAFESVGAIEFDVTTTNESGKKVMFKRRSEDLKSKLDTLLPAYEKKHFNLIVRPRSSDDLRLLQLDDLDHKRVERLKDLAFLVIETSSDNYQAWLAVENCDKQTERRLKLGVGSDLSASGATRIAGSINFKERYSPNFPTVRIVNVTRGRRVRPSELRRYLASTDPPRPHAPSAPAGDRQIGSIYKRWPSYERCLSDAPRAKNHDGPDRSKADFQFCLFSIDRGFTVDATAQHLMLKSGKAIEKGMGYARLTAQNAGILINSRRRLLKDNARSRSTRARA
jgi:RepB DNA-primase from phage plasmid